jgi:hypothetical protein
MVASSLGGSKERRMQLTQLSRNYPDRSLSVHLPGVRLSMAALLHFT